MNNMRHLTGVDASRVHSKLWVGSFNNANWALADAGFVRVVRCAVELTPCEFPLDDAPITVTQGQIALRAADVVAQHVKRGDRTLVTCQMGLNRSALVAGLAMVRHLGVPAETAIAQIKEARGHAMCLSNKSFVSWLLSFKPT
jgi:hypothetical protein